MTKTSTSKYEQYQKIILRNFLFLMCTAMFMCHKLLYKIPNFLIKVSMSPFFSNISFSRNTSYFNLFKNSNMNNALCVLIFVHIKTLHFNIM